MAERIVESISDSTAPQNPLNPVDVGREEERGGAVEGCAVVRWAAVGRRVGPGER